MRSSGPFQAEIDRRARGHAAACHALLGSADGIDHRAAALRHIRFVKEVLAELVGRRHPCTVEPPNPCSAVPAPGTGMLFVSAHRGNWIVGARALGDSADPLHTVAGTQLHPLVSGWLVRWLRRQGVEVHPPGSSWSALQGALRQGGRVFLHLDGDPYPAGKPGWKRRSVPPGVRCAALLATRCVPQVHGVLCERSREDGFVVRSTVLQASPEGAGPRAPGTELWETALMTHLRTVVAAEPEDWILFRDGHLVPEAR